MKKLILLLAICFALCKISSAQIVCIFCYDQNDSISTGINNLLQNGGFEAPSCVTGSFCPVSSYYTCNIPNWICTGGGSSTYAQVFDVAGAWYGSFLSEIIEGTYSVYMGNFYCEACSPTTNDTSCLTTVDCTVSGIPPGYPYNADPTYGLATGVSIEQTVSGLTVGSTYVLEFWAGGEYDGLNPDGLFAVDVGFGNTFLRDKPTDIGATGTRFIIEFNATATSHTIKFTNWGHICSSCTELVLDDVRLYTLAELSSSVPPCSGSVPNAIFTAPNHICPGDCINFTNLSSGANTYQWTFAGATPATSTDANPQNICYSTPGQYSVQLIAGNGSVNDTLTLNNYITVYPQPVAPTFTQIGDTLFATQGYASYQWYFYSDTIAGATNYFYVATQSGNYNMVVTDGNGCAVGAGILNVIASLKEFGVGSSEFTIFPNLFTGEFVVRSSLFIVSDISIYNVLGEKVYSVISNSQHQTINTKLSKGIYFVRVSAGQKTTTLKLAVE